MHTNNRVVVTGMGTLTPIGNDVATFWQGLIQGKNGIGPITQFDAAELSSRIAGEVKQFQPENYMDRKDARRMDRFAQLAVAASSMALDDAALDLDRADRDRIGVIIGSGIGGIKTLEEQMQVMLARGASRVSPFLVPMMIPDMASGQVSITFGLRGHNSSSVSACASGAHSIGDAFRIIQRGDADIMVAGGSEAGVSKLAMAGFCSLKALSTRNDDPAHASRPFDAHRDGFVLGEGAGVLVLESLSSALGRGARIYAELVGYGATGDAHHITVPAPQGAGAAAAMRQALADADVQPTQVQYINAHGTSTDYNDHFETLAIKSIFGDHAYEVAISSTKSMTGHLLGAAGGIEAIASIMAIQNSMVPPTTNYEVPDPRCDLDYVPNEARAMSVDTVVSNSFGFGGHNAVLVFRKYVD